QSLEKGYDVSVFVHKNVDSLGDMLKQLTIYRGDAKDCESVDAAVKGQDAVLVALGGIPGKKDFILSKSTLNIVRAMQKNNVKRIIIQTGAGLIENKKELPLMWRLTARFPFMKIMFNDKRAQEKAVRDSKLDWVIVRPVNLSNEKFIGNYEVGESLQLKLSSKISRADVADFMVKQLSDDKWLKKAAIITGN
ncbi:MAG: NAD(P)H-binding protein, partial [Candidatus Saccharibacteria bacterium]